MKTTFTVVNDIHIGSKYCDDKNALKKLLDLKPDYYTVLNGDVVDRSACPKEDVKKLTELMRDTFQKHGENFISGNHELTYKNIYVIKETKAGNKVMFQHGDLLKDFDKWSKYREKKPGAGPVKLLWVAFADTQDWVKDKINTQKLEPFFKRCANEARPLGCKYIVLGHLHPAKKIQVEVDGVTVIVLPKGFNTLELE